MGCKKCDCEMRLYTQNLRHQDEMERLSEAFNKLRREMAWLEYELTGRKKALDKFEFYLKNGGF